MRDREDDMTYWEEVVRSARSYLGQPYQWHTVPGEDDMSPLTEQYQTDNGGVSFDEFDARMTRVERTEKAATQACRECRRSACSPGNPSGCWYVTDATGLNQCKLGAALAEGGG